MIALLTSWNGRCGIHALVVAIAARPKVGDDSPGSLTRNLKTGKPALKVVDDTRGSNVEELELGAWDLILVFVAATILVCRTNDVVLHTGGVVDVLFAVIVPREVRRYLVLLQDWFERRHQRPRRAVLAHAPHRKVPRNKQEVRGRCRERLIEPSVLCVRGSTVVRGHAQIGPLEFLPGERVGRLARERDRVKLDKLDGEPEPRFDPRVVERRVVPVGPEGRVLDLGRDVAVVIVVPGQDLEEVGRGERCTVKHILERVLEPLVVCVGGNTFLVEIVAQREGERGIDLGGFSGHCLCGGLLRGCIPHGVWQPSPITHDQAIEPVGGIRRDGPRGKNKERCTQHRDRLVRSKLNSYARRFCEFGEPPRNS
eukprot:m.82662 g.82662  ORF g.82662 m.82662 type:complete len:369 (+) comp19565_c0_seq1:498-1604(+)